MGYGNLTVHGMKGPVAAHRVAYALEHGVCPGNLVVMHTCDVKPCVNPAHLRVGTQGENTQDARAKGKGQLKPRTHCKTCRFPLPPNYFRWECADCRVLRAKMRTNTERSERVQERWSLTRDNPDMSWDDLVAKVGERSAIFYARNHGLYMYPLPEKLDAIAKDHGLSRERVRQIVSRTSQRLGLSGGTFWRPLHRTTRLPVIHPRKNKETIKVPKKVQALAKLVAAGEPNLAIALELNTTERTVRSRIAALASVLPGDLPARQRIAEWWASRDEK